MARCLRAAAFDVHLRDLKEGILGRDVPMRGALTQSGAPTTCRAIRSGSTRGATGARRECGHGARHEPLGAARAWVAAGVARMQRFAP